MVSVEQHDDDACLRGRRGSAGERHVERLLGALPDSNEPSPRERADPNRTGEIIGVAGSLSINGIAQSVRGETGTALQGSVTPSWHAPIGEDP